MRGISLVLLLAGCSGFPGPGTKEHPLEGVPFFPFKIGYTWDLGTDRRRVTEVQGDVVTVKLGARTLCYRVTPQGILLERWRDSKEHVPEPGFFVLRFPVRTGQHWNIHYRVDEEEFFLEARIDDVAWVKLPQGRCLAWIVRMEGDHRTRQGVTVFRSGDWWTREYGLVKIERDETCESLVEFRER